MENKMTDNEIIKALEDYKNSKIIQTENGVISIGDVVDLIKRQKAEIERLTAKLNERETALDRLTIYFDEAVNKKIEQIKVEAIKEFAEAYKDQIKDYTGMFTDEGFYVSLNAVLSAVDFIYEKMVGEES